MDRGTVRNTQFYSKNKFEKLVHLVGFIMRIYHDARSPERQKWTSINPLTPNDPYRGRTAPLTSKVAFYIFIQQIQVLNISNMVYTICFFSSKCSLFHNSNVFGSCIVHILYTGCAKIKKKNNSGARRLILQVVIDVGIQTGGHNLCLVSGKCIYQVFFFKKGILLQNCTKNEQTAVE